MLYDYSKTVLKYSNEKKKKKDMWKCLTEKTNMVEKREKKKKTAKPPG
jgi:hypothetical protein